MSNKPTGYVRSRVNGGVISDQMLKGRLRFFKMVGIGTEFANTVSDGSVVIPGLPTFGGTNTVGNNEPVPRSAAEVAFQVILTRCTVSQVKLVSDTEIHFVVENTDNGWDTTTDGEFGATGLDLDSDAATNLTTAIQAIGAITVPDATSTGALVDLSGVTITEAVFELA